MRYAIIIQDGVDLKVGSSPLPEGAITPVPNWEDVINIPWYYLKMVGTVVTEKSQAEKDTYDEAHPPTIEELQEQAQIFLDDTDWYVVRSVDPSAGDAVPHEILEQRVEARDLL